MQVSDRYTSPLSHLFSRLYTVCHCVCTVFCAIILFVGTAEAGDPPGEQIAVTYPVQFTRNDGQWDKAIRYAVLHQASDVFLCEDGLRIKHRLIGPLMLPDAETGLARQEQLSLRFLSPSADMRIDVGEATETQTHFYPENTPEGGIENVPSFRTVTYRNVWENIDIRYSVEGDRLSQRIVLYPGADPSDIRLACGRGMESELASTEVISGHGVQGISRLIVENEIASLPYTPGVLRDTVVLETEFSTFFGTSGGEASVSCRVMPNGTMILFGQGVPPYRAGSLFLTPEDSTKRWTEPGFIAGFDCGGRSLRFCTYFGQKLVSDGWEMKTFLQPDDTTGFFLLLIDGLYWSGFGGDVDFPLLPNAIDSLEHTNVYSYLARISTEGILSVGTHLAGANFISVTRTPDRGVLLAGNTVPPGFNYPVEFRHYTREPTEVYPGILLKLNERCDSVLKGINLDMLGDTVYVVSAKEDKDGSVIIVGTTRGVPLVRNAWQAQRSGYSDIYLARLNAEMDSVIWATYLGGDGEDVCSPGIAINTGPFNVYGFYPWPSHTNDHLVLDSRGGIWLTGITTSPNLLEMPERRVRQLKGRRDILLARFNSEGQPTMIRGIGGIGEYPSIGEHEYPLGVEVLPCGMALLSAATTVRDFPQVNSHPVDSSALEFRWNGFNVLAVYDTVGTLRHSSYWLEFPASSQQYDPTGHIVSAPGWGWNLWIERATMRTYNAFQPLHGGNAPTMRDAVLARHYLPLCGEDAITCSFTVPDTIRADSTREYLSHERFPLDVTITNPDPSLAVFDLRCELRLPPGIVVEPDTVPLLLDVVPVLAPGADASVHWNLRVEQTSIRDTILPIIITTHYRWADRLDNCLSSHSGCRSEIVYVRKDSKPFNLLCDLVTIDSISIDTTGEWYDTDFLPVTLTLRNEGREPVLPGEAVLRVGAPGVRIEPVGDSVRALVRLDRNEKQTVSWQLRLERRGAEREILLEAEVRDALGALPAQCTAIIHVPGIPALRCALEAPERVTAEPGTGFPDFDLELLLENHIDTLVRRTEAQLDLSGAPHLRLAPGEEALRYLDPIAAGSTRATAWRLEVSPVPLDSTEEILTVWYWYQEDTSRRSCQVIVRIIPVIGSAYCTITGPSSLNVEDSLVLPAPFLLDYRLENSGNRMLPVDRYLLDIRPEAGLQSLDPISVAGGELDPGTDATHSWRLRALSLRQARSARVTVSALTSNDSILSVCMHDISIPGIDGLRCVLETPDTIHVKQEPVGYDPDPIPLRLNLSNVLDAKETNIEAEIDLTQAPRLELHPSESTLKAISRINSHAIAGLTWLLSPQPGDQTEQQQIVVRYRSDQQSEWKECTVSIVIEAWPKIAKTECETGGHDSLYADDYHEQWIPDPLSLSYRVMNTGTVTLTACRASIILPPEFVLSGSDIEQHYGTLTPGASAVRWWSVSPTMQLTEFKPYTIGWEWTSLEQGTRAGCDHTVHVVPGSPSGIVLTPLHLHFEAEHAEALPASQRVQLWTGGGLSMPWTTQIGESWLDVQPASGSQATQLRVQPNTTLLPEGIYGTDITVNATVQGQSRRISVTYLIDDVMDVLGPVQANSFRLDQNWPNPVSLTGGGTTISFHLGKSGRTVLRLYDVMGREVVTMLDADLGAGSHSLRFSPSNLHPDLTPGMYFYRLIGPETSAIRSMMVVR